MSGILRRVTIGLAVLIVLASSAPAQTDLTRLPGGGPAQDRAAVEATLRAYLRVTDEQDQASIAKAFHPSAFLMSVTGTGELRAMAQDTWWGRVSRGRIQRTSSIREIDVTGAAAIARVDITTGTSSSTDYFTLLKLADGWRIVNKVVSSVIR